MAVAKCRWHTGPMNADERREVRDHVASFVSMLLESDLEGQFSTMSKTNAGILLADVMIGALEIKGYRIEKCS